MIRSIAVACLGLLALAGCVETPPYTVVSSSVPPAGTLAGQGAMPSPPLASRMTDVTASHVTQVPGSSDCTDYSVTGTLDGAVRTVAGRSCKLPNGGLQVTERNPLTGQLASTTYPPPSTVQTTATTYGYAAPYAYGGGYPYAYGGYPYGAGYGYGYGAPFFGDPFFFGYPFGFGFGFGGFYGFHGGYGFRGGYGYGGYRGGYRGGGGGFHGGGGGHAGGGGRR